MNVAARRSVKARKTPSKTPLPSRKPKHGRGELKTGNPGNKGGSGRPPKKFKNLVNDLTENADVQAKLNTLLTEGKWHGKEVSAREWKATLEMVYAYSQGKPKQSLDLRTTRTLGDILAGKNVESE